MITPVIAPVLVSELRLLLLCNQSIVICVLSVKILRYLVEHSSLFVVIPQFSQCKSEQVSYIEKCSISLATTLL